MTQTTVLTIAGSDPTGGAGIQADLRTFDRLGVHGFSVITAITAQDSRGVRWVSSVSEKAFTSQLESVLHDGTPAAVKTGMLLSATNVLTTARLLAEVSVPVVVVDPVLVSSNGVPLLEKEGYAPLVEHLFPLAVVVTPNVDEAELLTGLESSDFDDEAKWVEAMCHEILALGPKNVVITGGHRRGDPIDLLFDGRCFQAFAGPRIGKTLHGSGCRFSAALTAHLAQGEALTGALNRAKGYTAACFEEEGANPPLSPTK
ncbi:MAG: bifunctional hydroxymethylpyrimidine kinase/phosphomethylpyrimidine kinase [bacterium]|nr:bifunctional hydroxymethylpyrimidine kinase/phosphomethylpyrimidine kinase [bacterium]